MKHTLIAAGAFAAGQARFLRRHPKGVATAVAAFLFGAGSVAVAALAPVEAEPVFQGMVLETVKPLPHASLADLPDAASLRLYRSEISRSNDSADTLLRRLGVNDVGAATFLRTDPNFRAAVLGRAGRTVTVEANDSQGLQRLTVRWTPDDGPHFKRLVVEKDPIGFVSRVETAALEASSRLAGGVIKSSLFAATDEARIPDAVAVQVAEIFAGDIDFHRALRKGDRFNVVYEALEADGEPLRPGRVLSAEFVNNGKTFQAMWFQEPGQKGGYYTLDGQSLRRAYLASPLEFSRISSGFSMRMHPIHKTWRAHLGVDYAAATGTPVRAVGDGTVEFAGVQNGYGNVVIVKHRNNDSTLYAHLSRIAVRAGESVQQGQNVGSVGATGWATGPHLHFEFRIAGQHQDPMTIANRNETVPVSHAAKPTFDRLASVMRMQLTAASSVQVASAQ